MSELAQLPTPTTAILIFLILESRNPSRDPYAWARCIFVKNGDFRPRLGTLFGNFEGYYLGSRLSGQKLL